MITSCIDAGLPILADKGYNGAGPGVLLPYKRGRNGGTLGPAYLAYNRDLADLRGRGERGFAILKNWRILTRVRSCPRRIGALVSAIHVLHTQS